MSEIIVDNVRLEKYINDLKTQRDDLVRRSNTFVDEIEIIRHTMHFDDNVVDRTIKYLNMYIDKIEEAIHEIDCIIYHLEESLDATKEYVSIYDNLK